MAVNLFEAAEANGIRRSALVDPLGLDADRLVDPKHGVDWDTLVAILAQLSTNVGGDIEAFRRIGRAMASVPSFSLLKRLGRAVFSLRHLYLMAERWIAPANVPHLAIETSFPSEDRMQFRCTIPEPHAPSAPYLHIFEGLLCEVPQLLGLPSATILSATVTPRHAEVLIALPPSRSLVERVARIARVTLHREDKVALLEEQRHEIAEGLEAAQRATAEIVTLFDRLPNLVVIHRKRHIVWANRAAVRSLGYSDTTEVVGLPFSGIFHASSRPLAQRLGDAVVDDHSAPDHIEAELVARDGIRMLVEISPAQTVSFGGTSARLFVAHNVTERKRLQQQLSISDRLASVGMLAAGVAHEVNNPLAYVLNNIEIARRELKPLGDAADPSLRALTVALEGVDRIRTIIRDLLALSRVDDDTIGSLDVVHVVESTLALATPHIEERARLVRQLVPVPRVRGTESRVGQVLLNLVANALEAMPARSKKANVLRVAVSSSAAGVALEVTDNGTGIAPEHAPHVFEPFFTTKTGSGTGLGLAISQRLATEIGGELSFESKHGAGTTFRLLLTAVT